MFVTDGGVELAVPEIMARAVNVEGISILGGEPFEQAEGVAELARAAKQRGLTVMVYSGYTLAELKAEARTRPAVSAVLAACDLLVDGRYDRTKPEPSPPIGRRWIGSTNQVVHYLTTAYTAGEPQMHDANTVEIHWVDGRLIVNGWPSGAAALTMRKR